MQHFSFLGVAVRNESVSDFHFHIYIDIIIYNNTIFFCNFQSEEDGKVKVGNHPVTYDEDLNIIIKILAKPNAKKNNIGG